MNSGTNSTESPRETATRLFLKYQGIIRSIAFDFAPSYDLLDDIVNDTFVNFVGNADRWDYDQEILPLLRQITYSVAMMHWRVYTKNLPSVFGAIFSYLRTENEGAGPVDNSRDLEQELLSLELCKKKLLPKYRMLLDAHYVEGIKLTDLAQSQNIKIGTLRKMMCRVRDSLRSCIEKMLREGDLNVE